MFKKLKDKIAESSPQRIQQLTQSVSDRLQTASDEKFFSLGDDDANTSSTTLEAGFTDVNLQTSTPVDRTRRYSNSSIASDVSFLPRYEPSGDSYHLQSDLDISASEIEDNVSTSSQLGHVSKEQIYTAFQKAQSRYHKYRGRYTDLFNHYQTLEKENRKIKSILVETQDKAIRRVNELKEQCSLEQKAKAHLENALRVELDERQIKIDTLETKIKLLQNGDDLLVNFGDDRAVRTADNSRSTSDVSLNEKTGENESLTRSLAEAKSEIENLNGKLQEMKANAIIFSTKQNDYKLKISQLEKAVQDKVAEIVQFSNREKENNLKFAQTKMELHLEIQNKELEISALKRDVDSYKQDLEQSEKQKGGGASTKIENLQAQNAKLIDVIETLNQKCSNYESNLMKLEQYKIEIANLHETVAALRKRNEEILESKAQSDIELEDFKMLKTTHNKKLEEFDRVTKELKELRALYENLNTENVKLEGMTKEYERVRAHLQEECEKNEHLSNQLAELGETVARLEGDLSAKDFHVRSLEESLRTQRLESESKIREVTNETKTSLLMLETKIKDKIGAEYREREAELKQQFEKKVQSLSSGVNDKKDTELRLMESEDKSRDLEIQGERLKKELENWKTKYDELENNHLDLINEGTETRRELSHCEKDNSSKTNEITVLQNEISGLQAQVSRVQKECESLREESAGVREKNSDLFEENARLEKEISKMNSNNLDLSAVKSQSKNNSSQNDTTKSCSEGSDANETSLCDNSKEDKLEELYDEITNLKEQVSMKVQECSVLQNEISLLQEVSSKQQNENCKLLEESRITNEEMKQLKQDLLTISETSKRYYDENADIKDNINDLQSKILHYKGLTETLRKEVEDLIWLKSSSENAEVLQSENVRLEDELKKLLQENDSLSKSLEELNEINKSLEKHIAEKEEEKNLLQRKNREDDSLLQINEELQSKYDSLADEFEQYKLTFSKEFNEFKKKIVNLKKELTITLEEYQKILAEKEQLNTQFTTLDKNQNITLQKLNEMEELNKKLKEEISTLRKENNEHVTLVEQIKQEEENLEKSMIEKEKAYKQEKDELCKKIEELEEFEIKYQNVQKTLQKQLSEIEELKSIKSNYTSLSEEKDTLQKQLDQQKNEHVQENKRLKQELLDVRVLNESLKGSEREKFKLLEEVSNMQAQIGEILKENQALGETLSQLQRTQSAQNEILSESETVKEKYSRVTDEIAELQKRNHQLSSDYTHVLSDNEKLANAFEEFKVRHELMERENANFDRVKTQMLDENQALSGKLKESEGELRKLRNEISALEKLQNSAAEHTESQTSTLKRRISELEDVKMKYEVLYDDHKLMKTDKNNLTKLYDAVCQEKKALHTQLQELERHYNEILHEKQLLKDEIQELKISPLNHARSHKLDDLELLKSESVLMENARDSKYLKEIESLREKLENYKSIDKANRSSIEYYENELQKMKIKNEKINRDLDEAVVTLPAFKCSDNDLGDPIAVLEYLRNVLYNYMIGKESLVLAKVIAAVCKFDRQQTELIIQKEQQKQTLLGQLFGS